MHQWSVCYFVMLLPLASSFVENRRQLQVRKQVRRRSAFVRGLSRCLVGILVSFYALMPWADEKQRMNFGQRDGVKEFVKSMVRELESSYYDPGLHGVDLKKRGKEAIERIDKVDTLSEAYGIIAWMLDPLNDSHTYFLPPPRPYHVENGWELGFVGDKCYILAVQPGSDAAKQGIKPGDEVLALEGYTPTRDNLWKLQYAFEGLAPRSAMHLNLRSSDGATRMLLVKAKVEKLEKVVDPFGSPEYFRSKRIGRVWESRTVVMGDDMMIWRLPEFDFETGKIDNNVRQACKHKKLVLDLRSNPGGAETELGRLISSIFEKEITVGEHVGRQGRKTWTVKSRGMSSIYSGKLVVLIDSDSSSAAEVFARVVQMEKRGLVLGDRSAGKVMAARDEFLSTGRYEPFYAGLSITVADLVLSDGKSLEGIGVYPDLTVLPTAQDLSASRDPALARAAAELGVSLSPEEAGKLFPRVWSTN